MNDLYDSNQYFGDYQMNAGSQYGNQGPAMPYGNQEPAMPYGESSQMPSQTYVSSPQQNQMYGASQTSGQTYGNQQYNFMQSNSAPPSQYQPIPTYSGKPIEEHGLVLGIVSCAFGFAGIIFYFLSVGGLTLGIIGLVQSKKNQNNVVPKIVNIIGIVINSLVFLLLLFVIIVFVAALLASS